MKNADKKTILLVEDDAIIAMMEKKQLESKGYIIHHVGTGEKAIQTILDNTLSVDLVLMDIDLGDGIDGAQAAQEITKQKDIPVVFLSSHTEPEVVEKTEKAASYGYVVKNSGTIILDISIKMAFKLFDANTKTKSINDELESMVESLRIHQLELENQNEELCENQAELEAMRLKYSDLYDMLPVGYFTLSETGVILEANLTGADFLGINRNNLLKQPFSAFIINADQDVFYLHRKVLFEDGVPQNCELRMKRNDGTIFPVYFKSVFANDNYNPQTCLVIMIENHLYEHDVKY